MSRLLLLGGLVLLAAGPLLAPALPAGPAALLEPSSALVGAAALVLLFLVFAWPAVLRERTPRRIAAEGLEILAVSLPVLVFLAGPGDAAPGERAGAFLILAGAALATALWLGGAGQRRERDRWFAAGALLVLAGLPLANWALNEYGASAADLGYRLSPLLALRATLTGAPGADPLPCLTLLVLLCALFLSARVLRAGAAAALGIAILAGMARAEEPAPLFGGFYVPGRPVPFHLPVEPPVDFLTVDEVEVRRGDSGRDWLEIPGGEVLESRLTAAAPGTWLVVHGAAPPELVALARERGFRIGRSLPGAWELTDEAWLSPDGVIDVGGDLGEARLDRLAAAGTVVIRSAEDLPEAAPIRRGTRRPWEEPGRILDPDGLRDLFPARGGYDRARSRDAFLACLAWAVVAAAILRWGRGRRAGRAILALLAAGILGVGVSGYGWEGRVADRSFRVREGGRTTEVRFVRGTRHPADVEIESRALPQPLAGVRGIEARREGYRVEVLSMSAPDSFLLVTTGFAESPGPEGPPDLLIGPAGLATPGEAWLPAGEFLRRLGPRDRVRAAAVRKLLRAGDLPRRVYEVRFPEGGMDVRPSR